MNISRIVLQEILVAIVFAGIALSLAYVVKDPRESASALPIAHIATPAEEGQVRHALPVRLTIPEINVDAAVEYVGLAPGGTMGIPKGPQGVAWFQLGQRPGEEGSAVIAGHYGWKDGKAAVFDNLHTLRKGDKIYVEDGNGATITFVVRALRTYRENGDATDVFSSSDGKAHLNLITCKGVWNKAQKSYSDRLVVFSDKEETEES